MAKSKEKSLKNYAFESLRENGGAFTKICFDMQQSPAWKNLNLRQQGLYLHLKSKFTKYKNQDTNQNNISIPKSEALTIYGDLRTFRKDIDILIKNGFIKQIASGYNTRTANIYGFSALWKSYEKENFNIPEKDKRYIPKKYNKNTV